MSAVRNIRVALAGNPNSGKTSIFNALTGSRQHVGNYPGVTVEKREGHFILKGSLQPADLNNTNNTSNESYSDINVDLLDLPGTYSLTSYSPEERITQNVLLESKHDVVVVVVDSTTLKRSLVLLSQLMLLGVNPVLCLNMSDEAKRSGQKIDLDLLKKLLSFPIVETIGHKAIGIDGLKTAILEAYNNPVKKARIVLGDRLENAIDTIKSMISKTEISYGSPSWISVKLLENDHFFIDKISKSTSSYQPILETATNQRESIEKEYGEDISLFITERYYAFVDGLLREVVKSYPREDARMFSDRIDQILVNRLLGLPIFLFAMYLLFWLTFTIGDYPMGWIESFFGYLGDSVNSFWSDNPDSLLKSLLADGIIAGVGGVVVFLPNIILLFLGLIFLEDTGYMARAAFLMDNLMHKFGLHGRSFIPLMSGFGCSIPGIMATRTLENEKDRLTTMMVLPLMSCGARLPIWMLLVPAFFHESLRATMLWIIYVFGIVLALVLSLVLRHTFFKGEDAPFVMELPPYRTPTLRSIIMRVFERSWLYLQKAGTVILAISIAMWVFSTYPQKTSFDIDDKVSSGKVTVVSTENFSSASEEEKAKLIEKALQTAKSSAKSDTEVMTDEEIKNMKDSESLLYSFAGRVGKLMEPIMIPIGLDWKLGTALLGAFAAKEVFVAQIGVVYSMGGEGSSSLEEALRKDYTPVAGLSLMIFLLIATPCMATVAVTKRESGSWKWAGLQFFGLTAIAYFLSFSVYQIGSLIF